jgi:hypothetical protein
MVAGGMLAGGDGSASPFPSSAEGGFVVELSERERRLWAAHEWVLHDQDVQRQYAGQVVAAHDRTVWGVGKTHQAALNDALSRPGCPPRGALVTVAVEGCPLSTGPIE